MIDGWSSLSSNHLLRKNSRSVSSGNAAWFPYQLCRLTPNRLLIGPVLIKDALHLGVDFIQQRIGIIDTLGIDAIVKL